MKLAKYILLILLSTFFTFCTSNTILEKPDDLLTKEEMTDVLTDILIANAAKRYNNINNEREVNYYPLVFDKYQIDSTQFRNSIHYYVSRIDDYDEILLSVQKNLKDLKDKYEKERFEKDSLLRKNIQKKRRDEKSTDD